jgi:hypothetical protein
MQLIGARILFLSVIYTGTAAFAQIVASSDAPKAMFGESTNHPKTGSDS